MSIFVFYVLGIVLLLGALALRWLSSVSRKRRRLVAIERLRRDWGNAVTRDREFPLYRQVLSLRHDTNRYVDDHTWSDLGLDAVFSEIDRTYCSLGDIELYHILRIPEQSLPPLVKRDEVIARFETDVETREQVYLALSSLGRTQYLAGLVDLIWGTLPPYRRAAHVFAIGSSIVTISLLAGTIVFLSTDLAWRVFATLCGLSFILNAFLHYRVRNQFYGQVRVIRYIAQMVRTARALSNVGGMEESNRRLQKASKALSAISRSAAALPPEQPAFELTDIVREYLSIFVLQEVRAFFRAHQVMQSSRASLQDMAETLGQIDALLSVASYRQGLGTYAKPVFTSEPRTLIVEDLVHPLVDAAVKNSVEFVSRGCLITGPNMAGKSTFLRALGISVILAQTIVSCTASKYSASVFQVITSLSTRDDLASGRSYYLAEAERLLAMIRCSSGPISALCVVDEILRGTSSGERLAISQEILSYLATTNALVIAATHDVELVRSLEPLYDCRFFSASMEGGDLKFDYRLNSGIADRHTAIALLETLHYPKEIITGARQRLDGVG